MIAPSDKLSITKTNIDRIIALIKTGKGKDEEFEVRFGLISNSKFTSSIPKDRFLYLQSVFLQRYPNYKLSNSVVYIKDNYRKIVNLDTKDTSFVYKERKQVVDIGYSNQQLATRFSISEEKEVPEFDLPSDAYKRERKRLSFIFNDYVIEITTVFDGFKYSYEVEIEYINLLTVKEVFIPIKEVYVLIGFQYEEFKDYLWSQIIHLYGKPFENKPINITRNAIKAGLSNYAITNKLNGIRYFLLSSSDGVYLVNEKSMILMSLDGTNSINVIDGEYFNDKYYAFDILTDDGNDVRNESFVKRIDRLQQKKSNTINLKKWFISDSIYTSVNDALTYIKSTFLPEDNDGLIFQPMNESYRNKVTYKYKPPTNLTIDFRVKRRLNLPINKFNLYMKVKEGESIFVGNREYPFQGSATITSDEIKRLSIKNNDIIEFKYSGNNFIPIVNRTDKSFPNFIRTVFSVWNDINNPITESELLSLLQEKVTLKRESYRIFHNNIKRNLILTYANKKNVIDIGSGHGGDLMKYNNANVKSLVLVEPSEENLEELRKRIPKNMSNIITIEPVPFQDLSIPNHMKFEVISSFFSLTFFPEMVDRFTDTFTTLISKDGTYFIGTTADGYKIHELIKDKDTYQNDLFSIKKITSDKVIFDIKGTSKIVKNQVEYLVFLDKFIDKIKDKGYDVDIIELKDFSKYPEFNSLPEDEKSLSNLNIAFVLKVKAKETKVKETKVKETKVKETKVKETKVKETKVKETKSIRVVPVDETKIYLLPSINPGDYNIVRTGTIAEGSCFFHSLLRSYNSIYSALNSNDKRKYVSLLRQALSASLTKSEWKHIGNGEVSKESITSILVKNNDDYYSIVASLSSDPDYKKLSDIEPTLKNLFDPKDVTNASNEAYNLFKQRLSSCKEYVTYDQIEYLSDKFNKDIYFINSSTRKPYNIGDCNALYKGRQSIVILWLNENHYEILGRYYDNTITRVFEPTDPLILNIRKDLGC
jgi:hypothetical protein